MIAMRTVVAASALITALVIAGVSRVSAQDTQVTNSAIVKRVSVMTTSEPAFYSPGSSGFAPMPATSISVDVKGGSLLLITFSARGLVGPSNGPVPIVFIKCDIDGAPCQPGADPIEFLFPQHCCDTRSFTWAVHRATSGTHVIRIMWSMGNPTSAVVTYRTLLVEEAE